MMANTIRICMFHADMTRILDQDEKSDVELKIFSVVKIWSTVEFNSRMLTSVNVVEISNENFSWWISLTSMIMIWWLYVWCHFLDVDD